MGKTSIEWTSRTWNPVRGCSRVSEGCRNCYAERMASRGFSWAKGFAVATPSGPRWTGKVALVPELLDAPLRWRKPQRVFVNSMSDLFHERLRFLEINCVFAAMARAPQHTFQILTKRPERALEYFDWARVSNATVADWPLPNVWLGASVEDQATADQRIPLLLQARAAVRFISLEPQLAHVDVAPFLRRPGAKALALFGRDGYPGLDWVIVGGESGPGARPFDVAWARSAVAQCKAAGVPVFVKQLGARPFRSRWRNDGKVVEGWDEPLRLQSRKGGDMAEWPKDLRVREFPA